LKYQGLKIIENVQEMEVLINLLASSCGVTKIFNKNINAILNKFLRPKK
jgi:hypothetical protein